MDVNVNFFFTWLSMEAEIYKEQQQEQRRQEAIQRARR